ncbi:MAG: T9SS type A sorting domain-containing protein [Chitinophagaceae bacterium]|jgi:hypothetical protein
MKKLYLFTLLISTFSGQLFAQKMDWVKSLGSSTIATDMANAVTYDKSGNSYTTGYFFNSMDVDPGPGVVTLSGVGRCAFVLKLDPAGNFVWAKAFAGSASGSMASGNGIVLEKSTGDLYITGDFNGSIDFNPGTATNTLTAPIAFSNAFVAKLDASGNYVWAVKLGNNTNISVGNTIAQDNNDDIIVGGKFGGSVDFDPGTGAAFLNALTENAYFCKFKKSGALIWAKQIAGPGISQINSLATDKTNQLVITGTFQGNVDFDPDASASLRTSLGGEDIFVAKYTPTGVLLWANQFGSSGLLESSFSVALDQVDNIYCSGFFSNTVDFDPGAGSYPLTAGTGGSNFLLKLNRLGGIGWAKAFPKKSVAGSYLTTDTASNIYTIGDFDATTDFDLGSGVFNFSPKGSVRNAYIAKYDSAANFIWVRNFGGTAAANSQSIAVNPIGDVFIAGEFSLNVDFNPGPDSVVLTSLGAQDAFIYKMKQCIIPLKKTITVSGAVMTSDETATAYQWFDCTTGVDIPGATSSAYVVTKSGKYGVRILHNNCTVTSDCVNVTAVGLYDYSRDNVFRCYPNPTNGELNIQLNKEFSSLDISIRNMMGKTVYNSNFTAQQNISISFDAPAGIYFVEVCTEEGKLGQAKILKQ